MVSEVLLLRGKIRSELAVGATLISLNNIVLELRQVDAVVEILR